jgi:hypothetical protein
MSQPVIALRTTICDGKIIKQGSASGSSGAGDS